MVLRQDPRVQARPWAQAGTPGPCAVVFRQVSFELVACGCLRQKTEHDKQYFLSAPLLCLWKPRVRRAKNKAELWSFFGRALVILQRPLKDKCDQSATKQSPKSMYIGSPKRENGRKNQAGAPRGCLGVA